MKDFSRLTLEEKAGQLFFLGFQGTRLDSETSDALSRIRPGGFLLFQRNIDSVDQVCELNSSLERLSSLSPFIAADQEGGRVDRLKHLYAPVPAPGYFVNAGVAEVRAWARAIAAELDGVGINTNFAPVLDLALPASIGTDRSFGADPRQVASLAQVFVEELSARGIFACGKHFPGLGGAMRDPHFVLPRIERSRRQLQQQDMVPFAAMKDSLDFVMVSHGYYPALGDDTPVPASLSPKVVTALLRAKVRFEGIAITDDLTMGAVTALGLTPDLFVRAIEAGSDMVLFAQTTPLVEEAFNLLVRAARRRPALRSRVDEAAERVLRVKQRHGFRPVRFRAQLRSRVIRQIERLRETVLPAFAETTSVR